MESVESAGALGAILQLESRLLDISAVVWRRVVVPECAQLRELHDVIQLAMDREGIHLFECAVHGVRNAEPDPFGESADLPLASFRSRRYARLRYVYDMGFWWEHELRVAERPSADADKRYPRRIGDARARPTEDCGGHDISHTRRDEATGHAAENIRNQHLKHVHLSNGVCAQAKPPQVDSAAFA